MKPNYIIEHEGKCFVVIKDIGPWDKHLTVTNGAETVVEELAPMLDGRILIYIDSEGDLAELRVENGKFAGFRTTA